MAMFFNGSNLFEQSWYRVTQGPFVPNKFQMRPIVFFLCFSYIFIGKTVPARWWPFFSMDQI